MKKIFTVACAAMICCTAYAQTKAEQEEMMKAWMVYMTPGDIHKMLANDDGEWIQEVTMWMGPDAAPEKSTMKGTNKMILGGRYQETVTTGIVNGMPYEGHGLAGYDNAKKVMQSTWIDNMGTGIMYLEGTPDKDGKSITFKGNSVDPITGKDVPVREVMTFTDDDTRKMEMFMTENGKEYKSMEIIMKRQKK